MPYLWSPINTSTVANASDTSRKFLHATARMEYDELEDVRI